MQKTVAYLGIGSNMGDKFNYLKECIEKIDALNDIEVTKKSSFYETLPIGYENQDKFINAVLEIKTSLEPMQLLYALQNIENRLHRKRQIRWGPRTIDIDILIYGDDIISTDELTIPHPRMTERQFVLLPLKEINNQIFINEVSIVDHITKLKEQGVKRIANDEENIK